MAIITEEPEPEPSPPVVKTPSPKPNKPTSAAQSKNSSPFAFWFYFTLGVSIITLSTVFLSSFSQSSDPKSFFLSLPSPLRSHYSNGRIVKVQLAQSQKPVEVFVFQGKKISRGSENVLIVHGLGLNSFSFRKFVNSLASRGIHGVAFDVPGNGFSDKSREVMEERGNGFFERLIDVYGLIKEKGLFWAFDNMVETGELPYEAVQSHFSREKSVARPIVLDSEEIGKVLGQVIGTIGLAPVHLVLHDSSLNMVANWVSENPSLVRSVTLVDTGSRSALPLWVLQFPLLREVVLGSNFVYQRLVSACCSKGISGADLESYRMVLRDGRSAVVGTEMMMNASFDVAEWGGLDGVKGMPMQVVWSSSWSKEWSDEGRRVSEALPQAKFVEHSGGRWPQDDTAEEIAEHVATFVASLPKSVREAEEERVPEHIQKMLDEAKQNPNHHHHHHGHSNLDIGHDHGHGSDGYMDAYGLGQAWGS
ncbi:Protein AUXIN RESPONSE 4 [Linum grandiflorum]